MSRRDREGKTRFTVTAAAAVAVSVFAAAGVALAAAGDLDRSFSGNGKVTTHFGGSDIARDVAIERDGDVVAAGQGPGRSIIAMARYRPDGRLDPTFGGDGLVATPFGPSGLSGADGMALSGGGKIVVAGEIAGEPAGQMGVARFTSRGVLDQSFAGDGIQRVDFNEIESGGTAVAIAPDGKIVVVGGVFVEFAGAFFAVARLNPNGSLDQSFAGDGTTLVAARPGAFRHSEGAEDVQVLGDGRIVVVGTTHDPNERMVVVRLLPNGELDPTFSGDGRARTGFGRGGGTRGHALDLQRGGKIVVAGAVNSSGSTRPALFRYLPNGRLDRTFAGDGRQETRFKSGGGAYYDVKVQDGRIVAAGTARPKMAVARYRISGGLDRDFSGDGRRVIAFGRGGRDRALGVALYGNGRIVAAGVDRRPGGKDFALARLKG